MAADDCATPDRRAVRSRAPLRAIFRRQADRECATVHGTAAATGNAVTGRRGTGKFKALCYCNGTAKVGVIESDPSLAIFINCSTPVFNPDGTSNGTEICTSDFVPLTKP